MRLIFIGDICSSFPYKGKSSYELFNNAYVIANLEGAISEKITVNKVSNSNEIINTLKLFNIYGVSLANNHIFDLGKKIDNTTNLLDNAPIRYFGVKTKDKKESSPISIVEHEREILIYGFGWNVIGCRKGVNQLNLSNCLDTIRKGRTEHPDAYIIYMMHWNYEFELYPQPSHRALAHRLINEGVDAIIGLHPHLVQGAELHNGKPIIYSLGNWFFPNRQIGNFKLNFPIICRKQLAVEIDVTDTKNASVKFHFYTFYPDENRIVYNNTENWDGNTIQQLTPFGALNNNEYVKWFKENRKRRKGLPIFYNYGDSTINRIKIWYVFFRQMIIRLLVAVKMKKNPSKNID